MAVNLNGNWQSTRMSILPPQLNDALSGSVAWNDKVGIDLPYHSGATYNIELNGDLRNVSSHLPSPLNKPTGEAIPVNINADGNLKSFALTGRAGSKKHLNSYWLLNHKLTLDRAIWTMDSRTVLPCLLNKVLNWICRRWMARSGWRYSRNVSSSTELPQCVTLRTPVLYLGGQQWNSLSLVSEHSLNGTKIGAQGHGVNATLTMCGHALWLSNIKYLYYDPNVAKTHVLSPTPISPFASTNNIGFCD